MNPIFSVATPGAVFTTCQGFGVLSSKEISQRLIQVVGGLLSSAAVTAAAATVADPN